jgi:hypothetical protein
MSMIQTTPLKSVHEFIAALRHFPHRPLDQMPGVKVRILCSVLILTAISTASSIREGHSAEREWREHLWWVKSGKANDRRSDESLQIADGKAMIRFGSRSDIDPETLPAEANQRFTQSEYRVYWGDKWPAGIRVEVRQKPADTPPEIKTYFLTVVDHKTAPRLELTTGNSKPTQWTMEPIRTKDRVDSRAPQIDHWGYIRATDVPGLDLWLGISSEPILKNEPPFRKGFRIRVVDYRLLSVSPKKEHVFHFSRFIPQSK